MNKPKPKADEILAVVLLLAMTVLVFVNVLSRYVLHMSISISEELSVNMFGFLSFIGAGIAARRGAHLGLTLVTDHLPAGLNRWVQFAGCLVAMAAFAVILVLGVDMVREEIRSGATSMGLQWPEWVFGIMVPIGCLIIIGSYGRKAYILARCGGEGIE